MTGTRDGRPLTSGEIAMLREVYGNKIPFAKIRICSHRLAWPFPNDRAMSPNGDMYMPGEYYAQDYAGSNVTM